MRDPKGDHEDEEEVDDEGRGYPHDRHDRLDDMAALRGEEDEDGVEEADEGPWRRPFEKDVVVPAGADQTSDDTPGDNGGAEWNPSSH